MNEQEQTTYLEHAANVKLTVTLTWGQCNLIDALIRLARETGDMAEYDGDLTAIGHAITDAMVSNIEAGLDLEPLCGEEG
jgi:hypothetical protein